MARHAVDKGNDFVVLLGDDVKLHTSGWKRSIEACFASIHQKSGLPFGAACIAFNDRAFPGFPTFPVIHRLHFTIFDKLLPYQLINQGGDPYLFALYNRFKASQFAPGVDLENTLGGKNETTRYRKRHVRWNNEILSTGITTLAAALGRDPVICMDVVVPVFRCDMVNLKSIIELRASIDVNVTFWLIVDNPDAANLNEVMNLENSQDNYSVNVRVHNRNFGASVARNTGLDYSDADWVVLLDDDVIPDEKLLDAYLGGVIRYPDANILVGSTHLPAPHNLLTHAMVACDLIGSFTIAEKRHDPPWGVTANLCVRGRSSRLRFSAEYPKTGGGEDIDYCVRAATKPGAIVAVPGALAYHPWWSGGSLSGVLHILGWARGESTCVGARALRQHVFFSAPNGAEFVFFMLMFDIALWVFGFSIDWNWVAATVVFLFFMEICFHVPHVFHRVAAPWSGSFPGKLFVSILAACVILLQESARFAAHLRSASLSNVCYRFDWVCGRNPGYVKQVKRNSMYRLIFFTAISVALQMKDVKVATAREAIVAALAPVCD